MDDPRRINLQPRRESPTGKKDDLGLANSFKAFRAAGPLFGSGIQLAAAVTLFFFIGRWLDGKFGTEPWLMLIGALIGAGGGLYNFIRTASKIGADEDRESKTPEQRNED